MNNELENLELNIGRSIESDYLLADIENKIFDAQKKHRLSYPEAQALIESGPELEIIPDSGTLEQTTKHDEITIKLGSRRMRFVCVAVGNEEDSAEIFPYELFPGTLDALDKLTIRPSEKIITAARRLDEEGFNLTVED